MFDVIIIGGGASGIMAAITAAKNNKKVLLIDAGEYAGKKLSVTGNGKCNLTNLNCNSSFYNQNIDEYLIKFNQNQTLKFFENLGLIWHNDNEGRVYPFSNSAKSVISVLNNELNRLNVKVLANEKVLSVYKNESYNVKTQNSEYNSNKVVFAMGGNTLKNIQNDFVIKNTQITPSLCAIMTETTKKLSGTRLSNVLVTAKCGSVTKSEMGEVLFKDSGLSGIVIFNLSCVFSRTKKFEGKVFINLMPNHTKAQITQFLNLRISEYKKLIDLFEGWFDIKVANEIIKKSGLENDLLCSKLTKIEIEKLTKAITALEFTVVGNYDNNQVFSGGVKLSDLTENLESKKYKGLYFCGEICDVDGECGGYNLQWAWTSGHIVGQNV